jgi:hypothetical protein
MVSACRIETMKVAVAMEDVDVFAVESGREQGVDRCLRFGCLVNGAHHAICRVPYEILPVSADWFHNHDPCSTVG